MRHIAIEAAVKAKDLDSYLTATALELVVKNWNVVEHGPFQSASHTTIQKQA